MPEM